MSYKYRPPSPKKLCFQNKRPLSLESGSSGSSGSAPVGESLVPDRFPENRSGSSGTSTSRTYETECGVDYLIALFSASQVAVAIEPRTQRVRLAWARLLAALMEERDQDDSAPVAGEEGDGH